MGCNNDMLRCDELFFELLQVAIGTREGLSHVPTAAEWQELYALAKKQSLVGIAFVAVQKLKASKITQGGSFDSAQDRRPPLCNFLPEMTYLQWLGMTAKIQGRNKKALDVCRKLTKVYEKDGFECCVMKGQSNRLYYPEELAECRTSGDVDIWLRPTGGSESSVSDVMRYFESRNDIVSLCYLHIENNPVDGVPVEVHFRPSFFNSPLCNRRFLKWMKWEDCVEWSEALGMNVLKTEYNLVFQMNHLYRHLLDEGIGLRQVLDYYYLLMEITQGGQTPVCKNEVLKQVKRFGMERFAKGLMWVIAKVFANEEIRYENENSINHKPLTINPQPSPLNYKPWMICEPDEKEGRFLLDEIMMAGNFGHYDPRLEALEVKKGKTGYQVKRAWRRMKRNMHFVGSYPAEVMWEPIFRVYHYIWRKLRLWRF